MQWSDEDLPIPEPVPEVDILDPKNWEREPGPEYSLWRNGVKLGVLRMVREEFVDAGEPFGFAGFLLPLVSLADITTVKQTRRIGRPGDPIAHQGPQEDPPFPNDDAHYYPMPAPLDLGPDGRGVPAERQFEVRVDDETLVPTNEMDVERLDLPPELELPAHLQAGQVSALFTVQLLHAAAYPPPHMVARFREIQEQAQRAQQDNPESTADEGRANV